MFALDSLYAHYAGICFEKDSCYGCIKNTQSCILSGLKKKNKSETELGEIAFRGTSSLGYTVEEKQSCCCTKKAA